MTDSTSFVTTVLQTPSSMNKEQNHDQNKIYAKHKHDDDDLIFGAFEDENLSKDTYDDKSPSIDEGIHLPTNNQRAQKRERTSSSISTLDDEWDNMLPITDGDGLINSLQPITEKNDNEQNIGMANFRLKHRLRRRSKLNSLGRWKDAIKKAVLLKDPWHDFSIDQYPEEIVTRHEFDPIKRTWHTGQITIKIESKPFAHGSMRECFRLKKLSLFATHQDWDHSSNYIAKRYIEDVPKERYFDDVMMQMTTKLWASHYNQHNPPKKVDIVQMSVLEFKERTGQPYYHLERFIEGNYIKYNSNSGFVCDDALRHTPQAFSHFTFEASCHEQIVVDIQGVGDLYTDPQIHTNLGFEYGEGNLGVRGMALFFSTHDCNAICTRLNLTPFDLSAEERERLSQQHTLSPAIIASNLAQTACRGSEEPLNSMSKYGSLIRRLRSQASISEDESDGYVSEASSLTTATAFFEPGTSIPKQGQFMTTLSEDNLPLSTSIPKVKMTVLMNSTSLSNPSPMFSSRSHSEFSFNIEDVFNGQLPENYENMHRGSSVMLEKAQLEKLQAMSAFYDKYESILGQIHLEMCKYYQVGRFSELGTEEFDEGSAFYHLELAAELAVKEAIFASAKIYLDLPRDLLPNFRPTNQADQIQKGCQLLIRASELYETEANLHLAQIYDNGIDGSIEKDWIEATKYYEKYIQIRENESNTIDEDSGTGEDKPNNSQDNGTPFQDQYEIVARLATLYKTGGFNLNCNYQKSGDLFNKAAEMATTAMKGRLATKYYLAAEEAYGLEPEE